MTPSEGIFRRRFLVRSPLVRNGHDGKVALTQEREGSKVEDKLLRTPHCILTWPVAGHRKAGRTRHGDSLSGDRQSARILSHRRGGLPLGI